MRKTILTITAFLATAAVAGAAAWPAHIDLDDGYQPEGIAKGKGKTLYVGSIPTGEVQRIDARTGARVTVVPGGDDRSAIGLKYAKKKLFVAGGETGDAFVYDARNGSELRRFELTEGDDTFVNDVAVARRSAYFTDSRQPVIYEVAKNLSGVRTIELEGFPLATPGFNLNGIETARGGNVLLAVKTDDGSLWRIKSKTGDFEQVDLGGTALTGGDGLLLQGQRRLYVVQNRLNQVAVVRLSKNLRSGEVVRTITSEDFDVPTTVARIGKRLYLPNARFGTPPTPLTDYWVTQVKR